MMNVFTQRELKEAFDKVCNSTNWKLPVEACVHATDDIELIRQAVIHFTGSVPKFKPAPPPLAGWLEVKAAGYYAAVGA